MNKKDICCAQMKENLEDIRVPIEYFPKFRQYAMPLFLEGERQGPIQVFKWCPFCGEQLPLNLRDLWFDKVESLGLDPSGDLPAKFLDDSWWREEGL